ncbi:hypothetical protein HBO01_05920 [Pseudomonas rhodesiae]|uniref:hypothetical protein n=1 Tax=Pseudomonas rhodesiae TaxID=76760 RepID=UPI00147456B3|nr:hypothetical protein [Pseudomonas rhodesiae]NMY78209.1 hypothetical protein [Pseudomonas rhodesiae]
MPSLKSQMRGKLASAHGKRTNTSNNLWICFSPKLGQDISLASNNELIYWLSVLESDLDIRSFEFGSVVEVKLSASEKYRSIELIKVVLRDGKEEYHHISSAAEKDLTCELDCLEKDGEPGKILYKAVTENFIVHHSKHAATLLGVLPFVAQIRGRAWRFEEDNILNLLKMLRGGTVGDFIEHCGQYDPMIAMGFLAKFILQGKIVVHDLASKGLGRATRWALK